jgi:hypothetical protein
MATSVTKGGTQKLPKKSKTVETTDMTIHWKTTDMTIHWKTTDTTIHWKALEKHFLMVPLVVRFNSGEESLTSKYF